MRIVQRLVYVVCAVFFGASAHANSELSFLNLAEGFSIKVWAKVPGARSLAATLDGKTIYVSTRGDTVYRIQDENNDGVADDVRPFLTGLKVANGIALDAAGSLYIAEQHRIFKLSTNGEKSIILPAGILPDRRHHGWRYIGISPAGDLFVSVGAPCNICEVSGVEGTLLKIDLSSLDHAIFAAGVRNSVGFDWHPATKELFFTDNGGDNLGDDIPPDELNRAQNKGLHFGYPFWYDDQKAYPQFRNKGSVKNPVPPVIKFQAHVAALGMDFYTGSQFPDTYKNDAFVAQHGSWNRTVPVGYRVMRVQYDKTGQPLSKSVFIDGWLAKDGRVFGRPVDIEELPDGSLLISDDHADVIYRVTYSAPN
ncbi:PQQ-dependent sugar dehydrogenase [Sneathiella sp.]|jgi:glucose/arabinose dehydrogenase|uniref:PQQ-dependent sugar dehydrogenase n=1 Tax=Sneathiella sp. TaxID=1964365 RepID=UPI0039E6F170